MIDRKFETNSFTSKEVSFITPVQRWCRERWWDICEIGDDIRQSKKEIAVAVAGGLVIGLGLIPIVGENGVVDSASDAVSNFLNKFPVETNSSDLGKPVNRKDIPLQPLKQK